MRYHDLHLDELLRFEPTGGIVRYARERALILDAVALGSLRKELIDTVGQEVARGLLTRFGFAHGWRVAESFEQDFPWDSEHEWTRAGGRLMQLLGLVVVENDEPPKEPGAPLAASYWKDSFEAEQHLLHVGRAEKPVCWTICGMASGYVSRCTREEIYFFEDKCEAAGDAVCHVVGRRREDWGPEHHNLFRYFERESMDAVLARVAEKLKETERRLRVRERQTRARPKAPPDMVVKSEAMTAVVGIAQRVAKVDATVLITGESGVGKERIARLVHDESPRAGGPFIAVNLGAITGTLLESELFGHAKGAFTGASRERIGLFEAANGSTIFLDEIGDLGPELQVKMLRVLQEREVRRVGDNRARPIDVRVVAATNKELVDAVKNGEFREDLYYRLRVVEIALPPLRDRRDDILPLARKFADVAAERAGVKGVKLTPEVADQLLRYPWPGNVRELENSIEYAVVVRSGPIITINDLPEDVRRAVAPPMSGGEIRPLDEVERDYIVAALAAKDDNRRAAAEALGIGVATLYRKLRKWGVS